MCHYSTRAYSVQVLLPFQQMHCILFRNPVAPYITQFWLTNSLLVIMNQSEVPALWKKKENFTFYSVTTNFAFAAQSKYCKRKLIISYTHVHKSLSFNVLKHPTSPLTSSLPHDVWQKHQLRSSLNLKEMCKPEIWGIPPSIFKEDMIRINGSIAFTGKGMGYLQ